MLQHKATFSSAVQGIAHLVGPRSIRLHFNALEAVGVDLGAEGRAGGKHAHVDAASKVDQLQQLRLAAQQVLAVQRVHREQTA